MAKVELTEWARKALNGGKLTDYQWWELAESYRDVATKTAEMTLVIEEFRAKAKELRSGSPSKMDLYMAAEYELVAKQYQRVNDGVKNANEELHRALLKTPEGREKLNEKPIREPNRGRVNKFIQDQETKIEKAAVAKFGKEYTQGEHGDGRPGRGGQEVRGKEKKGKEPHKPRRPGGRGASLEGAEDAAAVLAQFERGDDEMGSGVEQMKTKADKGPVVG